MCLRPLAFDEVKLILNGQSCKYGNLTVNVVLIIIKESPLFVTHYYISCQHI